jgi:hypothetical protein
MKKTTKSVNGTSFHNVVFHATPWHLMRAIGDPDYMQNGGEDKVNMEWDMETEDGNVFTIYDWKEYRELSLYEMVEWHIGGHDKYTCLIAKEEIGKALYHANV